MACRRTSPLCPMQIACDGLELVQGATMCGRCKTALERRKKREKPPRGAYYIQAEIARGKMH